MMIHMLSGHQPIIQSQNDMLVPIMYHEIVYDITLLLPSNLFFRALRIHLAMVKQNVIGISVCIHTCMHDSLNMQLSRPCKFHIIV